MPANYVLLAKNVVGAAGASSVTFSSIPQTGYTDLVVKGSARSSGGGANTATYMTFNGSSTGYSLRRLEGDGSAASSDTESTTGRISAYGWVPGVGTTANTFGSGDFYIPNYTSANYKSVSYDVTEENNATQSYSQLGAGLWSNTAAITSITLTAVPTFAQYTTFSLYGVAKSGVTPTVAPYATGGDTIMTDGTYFYHAFLTTGTFTPRKGLSCDVLVVAGGGGGGSGNIGGGGGAGGIIYFAGQSLTATNYTCTVGAGGGTFADGTNSSFGALTAGVGGGRGGHSNFSGTYADWGPHGGGSGGGIGNDGTAGGATTQTGTGATAFYGNAGGSVSIGGNFASGGGAGAAGTTLMSNSAAAGGIGINTYSSWGAGQNVSGTYWLGSGGASGANTSEGGVEVTTRANGGGGITAGNGIANTGGGGGGASYPAGVAGSGGSGIVIVRYPI